MRWRKTAYLDIQPHKPNINITALNINAKYLSHTRILRDFQVKIKNKCKFQQSNIPMFKYGGDGAFLATCAHLRACLITLISMPPCVTGYIVSYINYIKHLNLIQWLIFVKYSTGTWICNISVKILFIFRFYPVHNFIILLLTYIYFAWSGHHLKVK